MSKKDEFMISSASEGDVKAIIIILEPGKRSRDGMNRALHAASGGSHLQVVDRLLAAGADVNAAAAYRRSALQVAPRGGHSQVEDRLRAAGAKWTLDKRFNSASGYP
jgi:uroporphyrinogen-III synthase